MMMMMGSLMTPRVSATTPTTRATTTTKRRTGWKSTTLLKKKRASTPLRATDDADGEVDPEEIELDAMERMDKTMDSIARDFSTVRTGRANAAVLDRIEVEYYGAATPLKTIANASTPDAQTIVIQPFDKGAIKDIERALNESDLGMTPSNDGNVIRLNVPALTEERRKELAKLVSKLGEDGKVALRNVRRDAMKAYDKLEKGGTVGEDELAKLKKGMDDLTASYVKKVEDATKAKSDELQKV
jgi:ribosome recycling factor